MASFAVSPLTIKHVLFNQAQGAQVAVSSLQGVIGTVRHSVASAAETLPSKDDIMCRIAVFSMMMITIKHLELPDHLFHS